MSKNHRKSIIENLSSGLIRVLGSKPELKPDKPIPTTNFNVIQKESESSNNFIFKKDFLPKELEGKKVYLYRWDVQFAEIIKKGDPVCEIKIDGISEPKEIIAEKDGIIETHIKLSSAISNYNLINENEILFTIHDKNIQEKQIELLHKKYKNVPIIISDNFSKTKEIKWDTIAGETKNYNSNLELIDSLCLFSSHNQESKKLLFTFNYLKGLDNIIFKFPSNDYNLSIGDRISFLFDNEIILNFKIMNEIFKVAKDEFWGPIYKTILPITFNELNAFKSNNLLEWQIEFQKTNRKIRGKNEDFEYQFAIKKLVSEYIELVKIQIENYTPLKQNIDNSNNNFNKIDDCFVYIMVDTTNNFYKIGISNSPEYRERTLQSEKPTIKMIASKRFPNRKIAQSFEYALHQTYVEKRIRGEWFDLSENDVNELREALL